MTKGSWVQRLLTTVLMLCTASAGALWLFALTAKCESFGCIAVGVTLGIAVIFHLVAAMAGGALIWILQGRLPLPRWLLLIEIVNLLPVLWFVGRLAVTS